MNTPPLETKNVFDTKNVCYTDHMFDDRSDVLSEHATSISISSGRTSRKEASHMATKKKATKKKAAPKKKAAAKKKKR